MKFYVISDNVDTYAGMRLAGMEGIVLHTRKEVLAQIAQVMQRDDIGILLITPKLVGLIPDEFKALKRDSKRPVVVEVADRYSTNIASSLERYVSEAIGIKM